MNVAKPADATPQLVHVAPYAMHSSRSPDAYAPHSYGTESSTAGPSPSGVPKPVAVEYYGVGSTLLAAMAYRAGLLVFAAGRSIEA